MAVELLTTLRTVNRFFKTFLTSTRQNTKPGLVVFLRKRKKLMGRRQLQHHNPFPLTNEIVERVTSELPSDRKKLEQLRKEVLDWQERGGILDFESYMDWKTHMVT
eukprot:m.204465 g.204465  ORF g.204465 m.204465 type:complete len:106 (+) comp39644_c0_seq55:439-756(+)